MSIKEKIENSPTIWLLGILCSGFLAGLGTYKGILEIADLKVVPRSASVASLEDKIDRLNKELIALEQENKEIRSGEEIASLRRQVDTLSGEKLGLAKENGGLREALAKTSVTKGDNGQSKSIGKENPGSQRWVIQYYSSSQESEVQKAVSRVRDLGYHAYVSPVIVVGRTMYRARVGPFSSKEDAARAAKEVRNAKFDTWIVEP